MDASFEYLASTRIVFGSGAFWRLDELVAGLGRRALVLLGGKSAETSGLASKVRRLLPVAAEARCAAEPRPDDVDRAVGEIVRAGCDVVVAVGGGSVIDCAKAAAAMATNPGSLVDYLEGAGPARQLAAAPLPLVAVPTTAGTGSEVTKNAVIGMPGAKRSVRSPLLFPRIALVDPALTHAMPPRVTASSGMDALTQLLEAYLSRGAQPITDALAIEGLRAAGESLAVAYAEPGNAGARAGMSLASLLSGLCLANAGLGAVHGLAAPLGALRGVPHGVACAALLPAVLRANLAAVRGTEREAPLLRRLARACAALSGAEASSLEETVDRGLESIGRLQRQLEIPSLSRLGVAARDLPEIVRHARGSSMRTNPVDLSDQQLVEVLAAAM